MKWFCPKCDAENEDSTTETVFPMCFDCGDSFEWIEVNTETITLLEDHAKFTPAAEEQLERLKNNPPQVET